MFVLSDCGTKFKTMSRFFMYKKEKDTCIFIKKYISIIPCLYVYERQTQLRIKRQNILQEVTHYRDQIR